MSIDPQVELDFSGLNDKQAAVWAAEAADPLHAIHHTINAYRLLVVSELDERAKKAAVVDSDWLSSVLDVLWKSHMPGFRALLSPVIAAEYAAGFKRNKARGVPQELIDSLAAQHAEQIGEYFHQTSSDALVKGFTFYVNQQIPEKSALLKVIQAFGITPRQMSGLLALKPPEKVKSTIKAQTIQQRTASYIARSVMQRLNVFAHQEMHNLSEQANQMAWLYMLDQGQLHAATEKIWRTAKDEKVCGICGPMNAVTVRVNEKFKLPDGNHVWRAGVHVNCRCTTKLINPVVNIGKDAQFEHLHPRRSDGEFRSKHTAYAEPKANDYASQVVAETEAYLRGREEAKTEHPASEPAKPKTIAAPVLRAPTMAAPSMPVPAAPANNKPEQQKAPAPVTAPKAPEAKPKTLAAPPAPAAKGGISFPATFAQQPTMAAPKADTKAPEAQEIQEDENYTPTYILRDAGGRAMPMFHVMDPINSYYESHNTVWLDGGEQFIPDKPGDNSLDRRLRDQFEDAIDYGIQDMYEGQNVVTTADLHDAGIRTRTRFERPATAVVPPESYEDIIRAVANEETPTYYPTRSEQVELNFVYKDGEPAGTMKVDAADVGHMLGYQVQQFLPHVMAVTEIWQHPKSGQVSDVDQSANHGDLAMQTQGKYHSVQRIHHFTDDLPPVIVHELAPDFEDYDE